MIAAMIKHVVMPMISCFIIVLLKIILSKNTVEGRSVYERGNTMSAEVASEPPYTETENFSRDTRRRASGVRLSV